MNASWTAVAVAAMAFGLTLFGIAKWTDWQWSECRDAGFSVAFCIQHLV